MLRVIFLLFCSVVVADEVRTEKVFRETFTTAGYATAFGAALGAASLSLYEDPQNRLHHVAIGASIGFISGSIAGAYLAIKPVASRGKDTSSVLAELDVNVRPIFDHASISGIELGLAAIHF